MAIQGYKVTIINKNSIFLNLNKKKKKKNKLLRIIVEPSCLVLK